VEVSRRGKHSGDDHSIWNLEPVNWVHDRETYFRVRFRLTSLNRSWMRQRSGAIVDLRLCDVRESSNVANLSGLDARIVGIKKVNLFAILPASLKCRSVSPPPEHVRMLEGEAWSKYLGRKKRKLSRRKLTVYYWKGGAIDARKPFRAFLDLTEERAVLGWQLYAFMIITIAVLLWVRSVDLKQVVVGVKLGFAWLYAIPALVVFEYLRRAIPSAVSARKSMDKIRKTFRAIETWWFKAPD